MNKKDFLRMLENELNVLDKVERKEIIDFYEERFHTGVNYEGKTEEEIIAELEHPKAIARNVLEEYGVAPRFVKKKEERYDNVDVLQAVLVITFDVLIATWLLPTLLSIFVSLFAATITWFPALALIIGAHTIVDQYMFVLLTATYILLFFAGVAVLEMFIWTTKKLIIWHLNVFKIKKREVFIKKASSFSVDNFFKNHKGLRFFKNIALIGSIVAIAISGFWVLNHFDLVKDNYSSEVTTENYTHDFTSEIAADEEWNIDLDVDVYDVEVKYVASDEMEIAHVYLDKTNFLYKVDETTKEITLYDKESTSVFDNVEFNFTNIFDFMFNRQQSITIYLPENLKLNDVSIESAVGDITVRNVNATNIVLKNVVGSIVAQDITYTTNGTMQSDTGSILLKVVTGPKLKVSTSTGRIELKVVSVNDLDVSADTGRIEIFDSISTGTLSSMNVSTSTGRISVDNVDFDTYQISADTGNVVLTSFNTINKDGKALDVSSDTGNITLTNVFVASVDIDTDTGNIEFKNPLDVNFICDSLSYNTDTGNTTVSVGTAN